MRIDEFSKSYGVPMSKDDCGDPIIPGSYGDISEYGKGKLLATFWGARESRIRRKRIKKAVDMGFAGRGVDPSGADEFMFKFDGKDKKVSKWFIKALHCKGPKALSPERLESLRKAAAKARASRSK